MLNRPPYYQEADAAITCIEAGRYYSDASPFPFTLYTDHCPLTWIKTASKGAVTSWRIERINDVDYEIRYRPGPENSIPDALSRYPMLGPRCLTQLGADRTLGELLRVLPPAARRLQKLWLWAGRDTSMLASSIRSWGGAIKLHTR